MELVTDPFTGTAWYAGSATQNPTEMADLCITAFLNVNPTKYTDPYANSRRWNGNTVINGHAYLLQAAWDPVKQQCQA